MTFDRDFKFLELELESSDLCRPTLIVLKVQTGPMNLNQNQSLFSCKGFLKVAHQKEKLTLPEYKELNT